MPVHGFKVFKDAYVDSVLQLGATRAMRERDGVEWAAAAMGTPANLETLAGQGFDDTSGATANDCFLAVVASDEDLLPGTLEAGEGALFSARGGTAAACAVPGGAAPARPKSLDEAAATLAGANVAIVSVPGDYAALEAHKALSRGLHVLLFSDNVPLEEEIELKDHAAERGLLVMGPGAGTAMLGGTGLAFANATGNGDGERAKTVGIVAAAGTGAQEAMSLLDRYGARVTTVIGVGGRDLSAAVGGRMAGRAVAALREDPGTDAVLLVSKPPDEDVAAAVVAEAGDMPLVAALIGLDTPIAVPPGVRLARTLEQGVLDTLDVIGLPRPDLGAGLVDSVTEACAGLGDGRRLVRGLFSGGTLCYEALVILSGLLGPIHSNTPLDKRYGLPAPDGAHVCLDLGEEEFTKGRPHPMIDPEARVELIRTEGARDDVAVVLLDVVLGHGSHPDPAGQLAPALTEIRDGGRGPAVVAYVLGTEGDAQGLEAQRATLRDIGCLVPPTAARAAYATAAIARRRPDVVAS